MKRTFFALALVLSACAPRTPPPVVAPPPKPMLGEHGLDLSNVDRSASPCDDFYQYAVGGWRKANPLPAEYARYGRFEEVANRNRLTLEQILESAAKDASAERGSTTQKIGDFWATCTNETAIEEMGLVPIQADLDRIEAIRTRTALVDELHRQHARGVWPLFRFSAQNDIRNSTMVIAAVSQGGLGLPDREYYLRDDERFLKARAEYVKHVAKMFELAGIAPAQAKMDAQRVLELEAELARASMARADQRKPENTYHITAVSELQTIAPRLDWPSYFARLGLPELKSLNVAQPEFIREAGRLVDQVALDTWKAYLRWNVIDDAAPLLSSAFVAENFAFRGTTLTGAKQILPRNQRCIRAAEQHVGDLVGQEYVKRAFTPEAKARMNELIDNLVAALREDIPTLTWMGPETQQAALKKLEAFRRRIGYPDAWIDYASLDLRRSSYAENVFAAREFSVKRSASRVGKPDDPNEWGWFTPATVNASYSPTRNNITFPAGILQPPFYDPNADDAYNYGGIGSVIGHEMTHGFDDQGAKFDEQGNLRNWWSAKDLENFQSRAACIAKQYGEWNVEEGLNLHGELVTGEAIADLGGVTLAYRAYQKSLEKNPRLTLDGYSPEQRFFLGFAQVWGQNMAPEEARRRALTDPHAPGPARVNLTVSNMPQFADAWSCPAGAKLVRKEGERCGIW
jgi:putative endopeptidase